MIKTKILTVILLFILLSRPGFSQDPPIRLGLKVAPCISWMNPNEKDYVYKGVTAGVSLGFISEFNFADHYAITSGFNFSFLGGSLQFPYAASNDTGTVDRKYSFRYLEIPLLVKMKTREYGKFKFFAQIGFGTGFNLRTKATDHFVTEEHGTIDDKKNLSTSEVCFVREAVLVGLGTEYKIDESISLVLELSYSNSLNNVLLGSNARDSGLRNRSSLNYVALNIGILF